MHLSFFGNMTDEFNDVLKFNLGLWIGGIKKSNQIIAKLHTGCNHCLDAAQVNYICLSA